MPKYRVTRTDKVSYDPVDVEANDEEDAIEKVECMDVGELTVTYYDTEVVRIDEVTDGED